MSLEERYISRISRIWKTSTIVSVAKKRSAKELNEYRPVALTSIPFTCAEKIVLHLLRSETAGHQDPFQFTYSKDKGTEDANPSQAARPPGQAKIVCKGSIYRLL